MQENCPVLPGAANLSAKEELTQAASSLTPPQRAALGLLLAGETQAAAAAAIGESEATVRCWALQPRFRAAIREGVDARFQEACTLLGARSAWAIQRLQQLALDEGISGHARVSAARSLVQLTLNSYVPLSQMEQLTEIREELAEIRKERDGLDEDDE